MSKSLNGAELQTVLRLHDDGDRGLMKLDEVLEVAGVYYHMQCEADREVAKGTLKRKLAVYSDSLGADADEVIASLTSARLPATLEAGARIRNALLAGKAQLDAISVSLR